MSEKTIYKGEVLKWDGWHAVVIDGGYVHFMLVGGEKGILDEAVFSVEDAVGAARAILKHFEGEGNE